MLLVRRASIVGVVALALVWAEMVSPRQSLASIGLVAFAAMAQFTPHMILAVFGGNRDGMAARASLATGLVLALYAGLAAGDARRVAAVVGGGAV
jgi:Na+/proline symporter